MRASAVDLRLLRYFVTLAEERTFTSAARRLNLSQPALSQQIRLLERRLAAQLVDRSAQPLRLTPAGAELLVGARRLLAGAEELDATVRAVGAGQAGLLRVGVIWGGLYDLVLPALRAVVAGRPGVRFTVTQLAGLEQLAALRRDEVDVVVHRRTHAEGFAGLERRMLGDDPLSVMLPPGHPAARDEAARDGAARDGEARGVRLADLAGERFAMISRMGKPLVFDRCLQLCREAGFEPDVAAEVPDPMALAFVVAAQGLVGLTGAGMANRYPGVDYLPVVPLAGTAELSAVWSAGDRNPLVAEFVDRLDPALLQLPV